MIDVFAQILPSNGIVENLDLIDTSEVGSLDPSFTWVDTTGLTCTDGSAIQPGCVYNGSTFTSLPADEYGRTVNMSSDGTNDYYSVTDQLQNNFTVTVPVGTTRTSAYASINTTNVPTVAQALATQESLFGEAVASYRGTYFSQDQITQFLAIWIDALIVSSLPNRAAYIQPLVNWMKAVIAYSASYVGTISAMSDPATILNTEWNFASVSVAPPSITLAGALAINS
jgi:hypothetical protein